MQRLIHIHSKAKKAKALQLNWLIHVALISGLRKTNMKQLAKSIVTPPGWDASPVQAASQCSVSLSLLFASNHL